MMRFTSWITTYFRKVGGASAFALFSLVFILSYFWNINTANVGPTDASGVTVLDEALLEIRKDVGRINDLLADAVERDLSDQATPLLKIEKEEIALPREIQSPFDSPHPKTSPAFGRPSSDSSLYLFRPYRVGLNESDAIQILSGQLSRKFLRKSQLKEPAKQASVGEAISNSTGLLHATMYMLRWPLSLLPFLLTFFGIASFSRRPSKSENFERVSRGINTRLGATPKVAPMPVEDENFPRKRPFLPHPASASLLLEDSVPLPENIRLFPVHVKLDRREGHWLMLKKSGSQRAWRKFRTYINFEDWLGRTLQPNQIYVRFDLNGEKWVLVQTNVIGRVAQWVGEVRSGTVVSGTQLGIVAHTRYRLSQTGHWKRTEDDLQFILWVNGTLGEHYESKF